MRLAYLTFVIGMVALANTATAGDCGCSGGTSGGYGGYGGYGAGVVPGGHGHGYGGYDCNFADGLWDGFCGQQGCGCGLFSGCRCGLFSRLCSPNYASAGSGTWWYGYNANLCGCGGCGGCGTCGGASGCGCFGGLFSGHRGCGHNSFLGCGSYDCCGTDYQLGGCDCGDNSAYYGGTDVQHGAPSTLGTPTPAQGGPTDSYVPQQYSTPENSGMFYDNGPAPSQGQDPVETLPSGSDGA